jgi:hypothetical protein
VKCQLDQEVSILSSVLNISISYWMLEYLYTVQIRKLDTVWFQDSSLVLVWCCFWKKTNLSHLSTRTRLDGCKDVFSPFLSPTSGPAPAVT